MQINLIPPITILTDPLVKGRIYRLTFRGTIEYTTRGGDYYQHDAGYHYWYVNKGYAPIQANCISVDGVLLRNLEHWQALGAWNEYSALYEGTGNAMTIVFECPADICSFGSTDLRLTIEAISDDDPVLLPRKAAEQERARRAAETAAENRRREEAELDRHKRELERRVEELRRVVHKSRNFLLPDFRDSFIRENCKQLLSEHRLTWEREYDALFADEELLNVIRAEAPEVIEWHEARLDMILEAERLELIPPAPAPAPAPDRSYYEELIDKINNGDKVPLEPLCERVQDRFRDKIILEAKRRTFVRTGKNAAVQELDRQLIGVRKEITDIRAVIEKCGESVDLKGPREREQSIEDLFFADYDTEQRIVEQLANECDVATAEAVRALYAERRAKLFQQDKDNYA